MVYIEGVHIQIFRVLCLSYQNLLMTEFELFTMHLLYVEDTVPCSSQKIDFTHFILHYHSYVHAQYYITFTLLTMNCTSLCIYSINIHTNN